MIDGATRREGVANAPVSVDPFALAAGLVRSDLAIIFPIGVALALVGVCQGFFEAPGILAQASQVCVGRTLELIAMSCVVIRWRRKLEHPRGVGPRFGMIAGRIVLGGLALSLALNAALQGALHSSIPALTSICLLVFAIGLFWAFRLYFYFAVCGLLGRTIRDAIWTTYLLGKQHPTAVIRSLISPVGITMLMGALAAMPSPDGRSQAWGLVGVAVEAVFWVLATYTGIAFTLVLIDNSDWRTAGLDPYREERLRTLEMQGKNSRCMWLSPRYGFIALLLALCLWVSNAARMLRLPPSANVNVERCEASDHALFVSMELVDAEHHFRGFNPFAFSLASQTGFPISIDTEMVSLAPNGPAMTSHDFLELLSRHNGPVKLYYRFRTNKTSEAIQAMDNLWLWYNLHPLRQVTAEAHQTENQSQHQ